MKKENFIIFSTADWDNPFWTNKQHTAIRLASRGYKVFYIESLGLRRPTIKSQDLGRILKRIKLFLGGARKVEENIWVYSPIVIPFHRLKLIRILNNLLLKVIIKYYIFSLKLHNPILWTYNPLVLDLMKFIGPKKMIYHNVDDLSAAPGMDKLTIQSEESKLLKMVDAVFCTSHRIYEKCRKISKDKAYYFSNSVDYEHFSSALKELEEPIELKNIPHPRLGFIGAISEYKVDFKLICRVAEKHPEWHWILIGKVGEGQPDSSSSELLKYENIHFLGPKNYKILPSYIKYFDVCTIPCPINDYTHSMFPMKFYEYMAANKPIVAKNIDSLHDLKNSHYSYSTEEDFQFLIKLALEKGVKDPDLCRRLCLENTWETRLNRMLRIIFPS